MIATMIKKPMALAVGLALVGQFNSVSAIAAEESFQLEEVVVTARRRAENLQDIPVSVTAFTSSDMDEVGITDVTDISQLTPNLIVQPNLGGNDGVLICMRGLCRTDFTITEDPMVGIYVDGIYIGKSIGSLFDVAELDRIEVLRGPQGTLYGKNTLGGAVIMHTRKPSGEFGAKGIVTAGNFGRLDGKAYVEFPITDTLAANVSVLSKNHDPYVKNTMGDDRWDADNLAAHAALRWDALDSLTVDYAYDWQKKRETPMAPQITYATVDYYTHPLYGVLPGMATLYGDDVRTKRADTVHTYGASYGNTDLDGHGLTLTFDLGNVGALEGLELKSISSYREVENDLLNNATGASSDFIYNHDIFELDSKSQEFQLSGAAADGFVDFVVGVFYFNEKGDYSNHQIIDAFRSNLRHDTSVDNTSQAIFGEFTLNFTEQWTASIGLRYTDEEREQNHISRTFVDSNGIPLAAPFVFMDTVAQTLNGAPQFYETKVSADDWSPRLSVNYKINDDMMTYATYARGFKSGGFNARSSTPLQWGPYDDMQVDSYELGLKSTWMDNRIKFNITAFYEDITDAQVQVNAVDSQNTAQGGFSTVVQNAAEATVIGLETELVVLLAQGLDISAGYGYTDAEYDEFIAFDPNTAAKADISDDRAFEFTPRNSYNLSLNYTFPRFTDNGSLRARLDWSGQSSMYVTPKISGNSDLKQETYDVLNARIAFEDVAVGDNSLGVALWVKNLNDEEYKIGGYEVPGGAMGSVGSSQWAEPRTYGLDIIYRYGSMM